MSDEVKERIEKEAEEYCKEKYTPKIAEFAKSIYVYAATAERPKAWNEAIDECIEMMKENPIGLDAIDEQYLERLEKLKHKQP